MRTRPSPSEIWSRRSTNRRPAKRTSTRAGDVHSVHRASLDPDANGYQLLRKFLYSPVAEKSWSGSSVPGQLLAAGATQCFTISDMGKVWVLVNIYQNDVAHVHMVRHGGD